MGTNFYLHRADESAGEAARELHIGKSSGGWCFALHVYPERGISDLADWEPLLQDGVICDEYGDHVSYEEMMRIITQRSRPAPYDWDSLATAFVSWRVHSESEFHRLNHSERGPAGLLRHRIGQHCVAQGTGTWDCLIGDFS